MNIQAWDLRCYDLTSEWRESDILYFKREHTFVNDLTNDLQKVTYLA